MSTPQSAAERRRLETFRTLASERLTRLNLGWIQVEQGQGDPGLSAELQRELHTLKAKPGCWVSARWPMSAIAWKTSCAAR